MRRGEWRRGEWRRGAQSAHKERGMGIEGPGTSHHQDASSSLEMRQEWSWTTERLRV